MKRDCDDCCQVTSSPLRLKAENRGAKPEVLRCGGRKQEAGSRLFGEALIITPSRAWGSQAYRAQASWLPKIPPVTHEPAAAPESQNFSLENTSVKVKV